MSERARNLLTVTVLAVMAVVVTVLVFSSPGEVDRVEALGQRIKCPVCQGESIANSSAPIAADMMDLVAERVSEGRSNAAIIDELLSSYSGAVLLDPPARGSTLVLWIAPLVALGLGATIILWWQKHPGEHSVSDLSDDKTDKKRRLVPLLLLGGSFVAIVVIAGFSIQDRAGPNSGVADIANENLDEVSNETMEAVIAANSENPQVDGMRLALAERYYEEGDYRSAFPQYLAVAGSDNATDAQAVTALIRLGWMAWDGNGEVDAAVGLFDQALAIEPDSTTARFLKGEVLWCGAGDTVTATELFEGVLSDPSLESESRQLVEDSLDAVRTGQDCR